MSNSALFTRLVFGIIFCGVFGTASALTLDQNESNYGYQLQAKRQPMSDQLRNSLVEPYLEPIQIKSNSTRQDSQKVIKVWIMADDRKGAKIYFNQVSQKFGLAHYQPGKRSFTYANYQELQKISDVFQLRN